MENLPWTRTRIIYSCIDAFGPSELDTLERIFSEAWSEVELRYPDRDKSRDAQLQTVARQKLIAIATVKGLEEPMRLWDEVIKGLG